MRQAYDYWQDQPGNYSTTRFRARRRPKPEGPERRLRCFITEVVFKRHSRRITTWVFSEKHLVAPVRSTTQSTLSPGLTHSSSFHRVFERHRSRTLMKTIQQPAHERQTRTDLRSVNCVWFSHQQVIRNLLQGRTTLQTNAPRLIFGFRPATAGRQYPSPLTPASTTRNTSRTDDRSN